MKMNIQQGDIIIRRFQDNNTVWVSERYICNLLGDGMAEYLRVTGRRNYKKSVQPCFRDKDILPVTGKAWRYARLNGRFYYDYDFIPDRKDTQYRSRLGEKEALLLAVDELEASGKAETKTEVETFVKSSVLDRVDNADLNFYKYYKHGNVCVFNPDKARELAEAISWARMIRIASEKDSYKTWGIKTKKEFYAMCADILHKKRLEGLSITTGESLRKWMHYFPADTTEQRLRLISGRYGNNNARIIGKDKFVDSITGEIHDFDIHEILILDLWMNPGGSGKGTKKELYEEYCLYIGYFNAEAISFSLFTHYTNAFDKQYLTSKERHGYSYFVKNILTYIPSEKLKYANSLWCADGSGLLAYRFLNNDGEMKKMHLYVMMVSDVATGKIVGYSFSDYRQHKESHEMVKRAVLMGLEGCGRHEIMEFVSDNHGAFSSNESKEFLNLVSRKVRTIALGNSQGNYAETQFRLFKNRLRRLANWLSTSWDSKSKENAANEDYLKLSELPSYDEVITQLEAVVERWNNEIMKCGMSRSELYAESLHEESAAIDPRMWRMASGRFSKKEITRQRGFILLERQDVAYQFEIPNIEDFGEVVSSYLGYANYVTAHIYWDNECADVYTEDGRYMFTCQTTEKATKSHAEATKSTTEALSYHEERVSKSIKKVDKFTEKVITAANIVEEMMLESGIEPERPERYGIEAKFNKNAKEATNGARENYISGREEYNRTRKRKKEGEPVCEKEKKKAIKQKMQRPATDKAEKIAAYNTSREAYLKQKEQLY